MALACAALLSGCGSEALFSPRTQRPSIVHIDAAKYKGNAGTIILPLKGDSFVYLYRTDTRKEAPYQLTSKDGVFKAPAGKYQLLMYYVTSKDRGRRGPMISGRYSKPITISVSRGSTYRLKAGPPLTASIRVSQRGANAVTMDLMLTGRGGEQCTISSKEPRFQVLSRAGKVLQEGKFKFG
jgi:hypothetical protein